MQKFDYVRADHIADAVALLNEPGIKSRPLAGGTDLVLLLRLDEAVIDRVVDISLVPEMHIIQRGGDQVSIGAAATFSEVLESPVVAATAPLLIQACQTVGAVQIRNMGTLGGNVANAAACADSLPALVCLDASAHVLTPAGEQVLLVSELVKAPNKTIIPPGGLLVSLTYPVPHPASRSAFLKLGRRNAMAISRLSLAVLGRLDDHGRIAEARIVPGAATPILRRFAAAEQALLGQFPTPELFQHAAQCTTDEMTSITGTRWSSEFKIPALGAMLVRALQTVFLPQPQPAEAL
jgi:CO/xanthine dehydrogenase FAD-binding subunit